MNRNRILSAIAIAFLVGLFASRYVYRQLQQAASNKPVKIDQVVVAAAPLPLGTRLQAGQLRLIPWPTGNQPPGSFGKLEDCVGRAIIAGVVTNEPILEARLAPKEGGAGLPVAIPEGMRAVAVRVDDVVAVAGFTMPGTMVDVLVTGEVEGGAGGGANSITRTILERVRVLAAGQQVQQDKDGKPQTITVVTLLVDPEQANVLTLASTEGKIHLALRNTIDAKDAHPAPVLRSTLFSPGPAEHATKAHAATPKPPRDYVVEVIRAGKREDQTFSAATGEPR